MNIRDLPMHTLCGMTKGEWVAWEREMDLEFIERLTGDYYECREDELLRVSYVREGI